MKKKGKDDSKELIKEEVKEELAEESFESFKSQIKFFEIDVEKIKITLQILRATLRRNKEFRRLFATALIDLSNGKISKKEFTKSIELHTKKEIDANMFEKAYLFCSQYDSDFKLAWWTNSRKLITFRIRPEDFVELMMEELPKSLNKLEGKGLIKKKEGK